MRPLPIMMQCVHMLCSLPFASGPAVTPQSGGANRLLLLQLHSIVFFNFFHFLVLLFHLCTMLSPDKLVESGLTTHCPCQLKTGPVSLRQIQMPIGENTTVDVQFDPRSISSPSNVRTLVIQHHDISSSDHCLTTLLHF